MHKQKTMPVNNSAVKMQSILLSALKMKKVGTSDGLHLEPSSTSYLKAVALSMKKGDPLYRPAPTLELSQPDAGPSADQGRSKALKRGASDSAAPSLTLPYRPHSARMT